jgi:hypothetical protein
MHHIARFPNIETDMVGGEASYKLILQLNLRSGFFLLPFRCDEKRSRGGVDGSGGNEF